MNILHVVNISFTLPYFIGNQFTYFGSKGYNIHVACEPSEHLYKYALEKKFKPFGVKIGRNINPIQDIVSIYKLIRYINIHKIDYVIGHTPKGALIAMISSFIANVPNRIYFRHGLLYETSFGLKRHILIFIERFTGLLSSKILCVSPSILSVSNKEKLSSPNKNIIFNKGTCNGIDIEKFRQKDEKDISMLPGFQTKKFTIGFVGRLSKDKGITELIHAWKILTATNNTIQLLLVGPFDDRDLLPKDIIDYITTSNSIFFTGIVHNTAPFYNLMDVFILPSYREGFPTVVLEASSTGLPVITTRKTGCIDSIIENKTGIFIDIDDLDIVEKVIFYIKNAKIREQHGINGRERVVLDFDQKIIWNEIEKKIFNIS